jgi:hypothetical protein
MKLDVELQTERREAMPAFIIYLEVLQLLSDLKIEWLSKVANEDSNSVSARG